jgi:hypothetical protein
VSAGIPGEQPPDPGTAVLARDRAARIGSDFGLGTLTDAARVRAFPPSFGVGLGLGILVLIVAIAVIGGTAGSSHYSSSSKVTIVVVFAVLLLACAIVAAAGWRRARDVGWLFRYSGGFAQEVAGEPEPRVVRWESLRTFTLRYVTPTRQDGRRRPPRVDGFSAEPPVGVAEPDFSAAPWKRAARGLAADGARAAGPRLAAPLIEAYESGRPVIKGGIEIGPDAIMSIPWREVTSISVVSIGQAALPRYVAITRSGAAAAARFDLSGVVNGVAIVELIRHVAAQRGLPLADHGNSSY